MIRRSGSADKRKIKSYFPLIPLSPSFLSKWYRSKVKRNLFFEYIRST